MRELQDKINSVEPEVFNFCSELLAQVLFTRQTRWRMYMTGLANYADRVYTHSINVALLSLMLGKKIGMQEKSLRTLALSALLHDVGFLLIPKTTVHKTKEAKKKDMFVKQHCELGKALLDEIPIEESCKKVALQHHEGLDGSGYPYGLTAKEISFFAKIVMIADTFDLETSEKLSGPAASLEEAVSTLQLTGNKFDPNLVSVLVDLVS